MMMNLEGAQIIRHQRSCDRGCRKTSSCETSLCFLCWPDTEKLLMFIVESWIKQLSLSVKRESDRWVWQLFVRSLNLQKIISATYISHSAPLMCRWLSEGRIISCVCCWTLLAVWVLQPWSLSCSTYGEDQSLTGNYTSLTVFDYFSAQTSSVLLMCLFRQVEWHLTGFVYSVVEVRFTYGWFTELTVRKRLYGVSWGDMTVWYWGRVTAD